MKEVIMQIIFMCGLVFYWIMIGYITVRLESPVCLLALIFTPRYRYANEDEKKATAAKNVQEE